MIFPNFLRSQVLSRLATRKATCIVKNNHPRFTCGEKKIWENIKKSENIVIMIVGHIRILYLLTCFPLSLFVSFAHFTSRALGRTAFKYPDVDITLLLTEPSVTSMSAFLFFFQTFH